MHPAWIREASDPTSATALHARREHIKRAAGPPVPDRIAYLCARARGRDVLDVGCVDHTAQSGSPGWLHAHLRRAARRCLGVDVVASEVEELRAKGFDVVCADLTERPLDETFDVIVCGEVLEHLNAPVPMLRNLAAMLRAGGSILVTVPNPFYANILIDNAFGRHYFVGNADHVVWFDPPCMAELAARAGLELRRFHGITLSHANTLTGKWFFKSRPLLVRLGISPDVFALSMIYELGK